MGNCLRKCFGLYDKRRQFLNPRYSVEKDLSIEFQNLMDEEEAQGEMSKLVTEREKQLLSTGHYNTLVHEQLSRDAEIDRKLQADEEELRREEEAYIEAKREAAMIARLQQQKEEAAARHTSNGPTSWKAGQDGDWEVAGGEDDFEMFLESVRERSMKATAHLRKESSPELHSSTSSPAGRERSHTEGSNSIELEWDHDEDTGVLPVSRTRSLTEEELFVSTGSDNERTDNRNSPTDSNELEWDTEFVSATDMNEFVTLEDDRQKDTQTLLSKDFHSEQ